MQNNITGATGIYTELDALRDGVDANYDVCVNMIWNMIVDLQRKNLLLLKY